ncbi:dermonecrotic toxin domain-containing protein [Pseudomonas sp. CFBP 13710]|uniref:dermonecrotic toxin domain-containing protein n=1 Tax=Pseudomonas sp. CFBP 13710 TaxID=2775311 RepID=UPI001783288F|nr:DUF6543 domain-containing protein [Pseudomonas sp. CFBP 13710]MBD8729799.1 hypothetical protein [Pseudomonas sp. CFBP 13710]
MANTLPWFHSRQLAQCMSRHLTQAFESEQLSVIEYDWLRGLPDRPTIAPDMQVCLLGNADPGVFCGLRITRTDPDLAAAYYYSPLTGILPFTSSAALRDALLARLQGEAGARLTSTREPKWVSVTQSPFKRWMKAIILAQARRLKAIDRTWHQLPLLGDILDRDLTAALRTAMPASDPIIPRSHKVHRVDRQTQAVVNVQRLLDTALDLLADSSQPDCEHRFLGVYGQTLSDADALCYRSTLMATNSRLAKNYSAALADFWRANPDNERGSLRDGLGRSLQTAYLSAVLEAQSHLHASNAQLELLKSVVTSPAPAGLRLETLRFNADQALNDEPVAWPGTLIISDADQASLGYYIFSTDQGLLHCADLQALGDYLQGLVAGASDSLRLIKGDRALFNAMIRPVPQRLALTGQAFQTLADGLIDLQRRRVQEVFGNTSALRPSPLLAVAEALDLRKLAHPRLHWLSGERPITALALQAVEPSTNQAKSNWLLQIETLRSWQRSTMHCVSPVKDGVRLLFAPGLLAMQSPLPADELRLHIDGAPELAAIGLVDYFLERTSGAIIAPLTSADRVLNLAGIELNWPDVEHIEQLVLACSPALTKTYRGLVRRQMSAPQPPCLGAYDLPGQRRALRELGLRTSLAVARREGSIDETLLQLLATALDYPTARLRNAADTDVHAIYLRVPSETNTIPLADMFVLHCHSKPASPVLMWSGDHGLFAFDSLQQLKKTVAASARHPHARTRWLNGLDPALIATVLEHFQAAPVSGIHVETRALTGDFITELDALESHRQLTGLGVNMALAVQCGFSATLFQRNADYSRADNMLTVGLDRLAVDAANVQLAELLPPWIQRASASQLARYADILGRCLATANRKSNYLAQIPFIDDFSRDRLRASMAKVWPGGPSDPDRVVIKLTDTSGGGVSIGGMLGTGTLVSRTKTLTEWAISQFSGSVSSEMHISLDPPSLIMDVPTTHQVREVVKDADVGGEYRKLLAAKLSRQSGDYPLRRLLFVKALPAQMVRNALEREMQGKISAAATDMIAQVVEMPDGVAREPLNGQRITLGPLGLIPDVGMKADIACGMYLIAPVQPDRGPVVLYTCYGESETIREYASRVQLLEQIKTNTALQAQILSRLPEDVHSRYEHSGFTEPHIPWTTEVNDGQRLGKPPAIVLLDQPEQGNALYYLFEDNLQLIQLLARQQTMSSGEASWNAFCHIVKLGIEQGAMILPSVVGSLVALYQSQQLLNDSVKAMGRRRWGEALADFIAALASVVGARRGAEHFKREIQAAENAEHAPRALVAGRRFGGLSAALAALEANDVALNRLNYDALLNMYETADLAHRYAVVDGRVMEVKRAEQGWYIVSKGREGPTITLDGQQKWHADLEIARMGAGYSLMDNYDTWITDINIPDVFITLAEGTDQIRQRYPRHHQMIVRAHAHAVDCLRNALQNLNQKSPHVPLPAQTLEILTDVFEVDVTPAMLQRLRSSCVQLLDALTSDALDPHSSPRYWDGLNEEGHEGNHAFVWEGDPQQRIFLTEKFFDLPIETMMYSSHERTQAQLYAHHQAASLLHELSHQVLKTVDLAYLDTFLPLHQHYDDLGGMYGQAQVYARSLLKIRQEGLSLSTPVAKLFTRPGSSGRRDFRPSDGRQRKTVLQLTGKTHLADARVAFRTDPEVRSKLILANADSVTLLVFRLGQEVFTPPSS